VPHKLRVAFGFRHEYWFRDETSDILRRHETALYIAETDDFQTPAVVTADFGYFCRRKSDYPPAERKQMATAMREQLKEVSEIFAFFKPDERPESSFWAREVLEAVTPLAPLHRASSSTCSDQKKPPRGAAPASVLVVIRAASALAPLCVSGSACA
jgi:uncharacterized protein YecE (DUF72 family)